MINVIDVASRTRTAIPEGHMRTILGPSDAGTRVQVVLKEVDPGKTARVAASDTTQVVYILEGQDAKVTHTSAGTTVDRTAGRRTGVYLEPSEEATVSAGNTPLVLLLVTV